MDGNTLTMPYKPIFNPFVGGESPSNDAILDCTQKSHMITNNTHRKGAGIMEVLIVERKTMSNFVFG